MLSLGKYKLDTQANNIFAKYEMYQHDLIIVLYC